MQAELRLWLTYIEDPEDPLTELEIKKKLEEALLIACDAIKIKHDGYWTDVDGEQALETAGHFEWVKNEHPHEDLFGMIDREHSAQLEGCWRDK